LDSSKEIIDKIKETNVFLDSYFEKMEVF